MRYPGAFTFINRDTATKPGIKDYKHDTAISTHISRTRRRWTEEKRKVRLERLNQQDKKPPVAKIKVAIPKSIPIQARSPQDSRNVSSLANESTLCHKCDGDSHCSQCHKAQAVAPQFKRIYQNASSLRLLKGNSDPFSASPMPITPEVHELLELSSRFYVFWAWSVSASSLFQAKAQDSWLASVRAALSVRGAAEMCVVVASGASVKAKLLALADDDESKHRQEAQALIYKTRALMQLRNDLSVDTLSAYPAMFRLVSLEFHDGNYHAAIWHHKAVSDLLERNSNLQARQPSDPATTIYAVAEVWAAAAALQKPTTCGMVDWSGERRASNSFGAPPEPDLFLYDLEWPNLHPSVTPMALRTIFRDIQKLTLYMDRLATLEENGVDIYETVIYLEVRSSALRAEVLNTWVDSDSMRESQGMQGKHPAGMDDMVFLACCLAALLFVNIIFMYKLNDASTSETPSRDYLNRPSSVLKPATPLMSTSVNRQPLHRLQDLLQRIQQQHSQSRPTPTSVGVNPVDPELMTWLRFVATLSETLETESHMSSRQRAEFVGHRTDPGLQSFQNCVSKLESREWRDVQGLLRRFLYFGGLMDGYLVRMLDGGEGHMEP